MTAVKTRIGAHEDALDTKFDPTADIPATNVRDALAYLRGLIAGFVSGITEVVQDTSPQLGGNLDLNSHFIAGLQIGINIQAYSANLDSWSALAPSAKQDALGYTAENVAHKGQANGYAPLSGSSLVPAANLPINTDGTLSGNSDLEVPSQKATKTAIATAVAGILDSSPSTLDTLNELAAALGDDPNFATTVSTAIGLKLAKASNLSDLANASTALTNLGLSANGKSFVTAADYAAMTALLAAVVGDSGSGGTKGLVPAPGAGDAAAGKFLKASGAYEVPPGGGGLSTSGPIGYDTGAGGTVTQLTSKSTAVTLNKPSGRITMRNSSLSNSTLVKFTLNNSFIAVGDIVQVRHTGVGTFGDYDIQAEFPAAGSVVIEVFNQSGGSLSEAIVLSFAVIKVATS